MRYSRETGFRSTHMSGIGSYSCRSVTSGVVSFQARTMLLVYCYAELDAAADARNRVTLRGTFRHVRALFARRAALIVHSQLYLYFTVDYSGRSVDPRAVSFQARTMWSAPFEAQEGGADDTENRLTL